MNAIISSYTLLIIWFLNVYKVMAVDEVQDNISESRQTKTQQQSKTIEMKCNLGCSLSHCPCVKSWQDVVPFKKITKNVYDFTGNKILKIIFMSE